MPTNQTPIPFSEWLGLKGLSPRTIHEYLYYHKQLTEEINPTTLNRHLKKHNTKPNRAYINNLLEYIRTQEVPQTIKDSTAGYSLPKITGRTKRILPPVLNAEQIELTAKSMKTRNKLMTLIIFYGGLRISELTAIKPLDFLWNDWKENPESIGHLKITGKGHKQRIVYLPSDLMKELYTYIKDHISHTQNKETPLFNISNRRYRSILAKASEKVIGKPIHPHLIRHSCATFLLEKGLDIKEIAQYMGHKSIETTQIYLHINPKTLKNNISKAFIS